MKLLNGFTSAFFAILIANPLCCCFGDSAAENPVRPVSCCSQQPDSGEHAPAPGTCPGCQAKNPRLADGGKSPVLSVDLPELAVLRDLARIPAISEGSAVTVIAKGPLPETRPPRLLLILQQRFLI